MGDPWAAHEEGTERIVRAMAVARRKAPERAALTGSGSGRYQSSDDGEGKGETHCS